MSRECPTPPGAWTRHMGYVNKDAPFYALVELVDALAWRRTTPVRDELGRFDGSTPLSPSSPKGEPGYPLPSTGAPRDHPSTIDDMEMTA